MSREDRQFSLLQSLRQETWFKYPMRAVREVGPAVQLLSGLLTVSHKETYTEMAKIAARSRVPLGTARKQMLTLIEHGYVINAGREAPRVGTIARRTCTLRITAKTKAALGEYGVLPWWATCNVVKYTRHLKRPRVDVPAFRSMHWSSQAVLSVIMARLMTLRSVAEREGDLLDDLDLIGLIDNMGGNERFRIPLDSSEDAKGLTELTGLSRSSCIKAKKELHGLGIIQWSGGVQKGVGHVTDCLCPNWNFRVGIKDAGNGRCFVDFLKGSKSG